MQNEEKPTCNETLYSEVAEELDISIDLVKEVVNAQSLATIKNMKNLNSTRYVYLGAFKFNRGKYLKLNIEKRTFEI